MNLQYFHHGTILSEITGMIDPNRSGRGDAHPRVTGCTSLQGAFETLGEARAYMKKMGATQAKEVIKVDAGDTAPLNGNGFYAVANGVKPGICELYR